MPDCPPSGESPDVPRRPLWGGRPVRRAGAAQASGDHLTAPYSPVRWRWIFVVNVPIGLAALLFALRFLREHREPDAGRFDFWGLLCSGGGLALVRATKQQAA